MAPIPVNNPPEGWVLPAERRRLQEANGHAADATSVADTAVGEIVPRNVVLLGPAYDAVQGRDICRRVAAGESLQQICSAREQPELATVMGWLFLDEIDAFTAQYLNARSARLELMMDEVVAIADDLATPLPPAPPPGEPVNGEGAPETTAVADAPAIAEKDRLAIAKLRMDARRWLIDKQLKATPGTDTEKTGRLVPSEILFDGVGA